MTVKKAEYPVSIGAKLYPAFPYLLGADKLFEVRRRHNVKVFDQVQYPGHFLRRLTGQRIKKLLHRAFAVSSPVEDYCLTHRSMLTSTLTLVKLPVFPEREENVKIDGRKRYKSSEFYKKLKQPNSLIIKINFWYFQALAKSPDPPFQVCVT
ncbi:MAG: hypothetical protein M0024_11485 [Nitrospiraceae bacterium]|nr:hypothetical protein [Nitrospiraceae bacterium]